MKQAITITLTILASAAMLTACSMAGGPSDEELIAEVLAKWAEAGVAQIDAADWWDGTAGVIEASSGNTTYDAADSLMGSAFKAEYYVELDGEITNGRLTGVTDPWEGITWDATTLGWIKA